MRTMINVLLKFASVLTPEDIKKMKHAGYSDLAESMVNNLERLSFICRENGFIDTNSGVCTDINRRICELKAILHK